MCNFNFVCVILHIFCGKLLNFEEASLKNGVEFIISVQIFQLFAIIVELLPKIVIKI